MSTYQIIYEAKCKHCEQLEPYYEGKRKYHRCKIDGVRVRLKDKACKNFKLY